MTSGWHEEGARYTKVYKHSDIILLFFNLCQIPVCVVVSHWPEGKYRPSGHNIGEHDE